MMTLSKNEVFEIKAAAFYRMTGYMAPGKDVAPAAYSISYEERMIKWELWLKRNTEIIAAMLIAFENVVTKD